jgi:hypothetical protein
MGVGNVYAELRELLHEYLRPLEMQIQVGPLRAMGDLVEGMVFTGSVQVSNAARLLAASDGSLEYHVKRITLALSNHRWNHEPWARAVLQQRAAWVEPEDLIPIDATELAKPYARCMEHQCIVKDASRVGDPLVPGYWCYGAYHYQPKRGALAPLLLTPYSQSLPGFRSENDCWIKALWQLHQATGDKGLWLMDRGGDRPEILAELLRLQKRWIVRLREDRRLLGPDGTCRPAGVWADEALVTRPERGHAVTLPVSLPPEDIRQSLPPARLFLVIPTYTFWRNGKLDRWVLLTRGLIDDHVGPRQIRHDYAWRWGAEDAKRFLGQIWHAERFLTRSYLALERMLWCLVVAGGFLTLLQREEPELAESLERQVHYWKKPVKIPSYRLARGLLAIAGRHGTPTLQVNA